MEDSLTVQYIETRTHQTSQRTLQHTFQRKRPPQENEVKQLKEVFDLIASVPQGQKLLDEVAQGGYEFFFETARGENDGCMYAGTKKIMLCPCQHSSIAGLAATAFHEMTHAVQNDRTKGKLDYKCANMNMADQIKFQRAAEAAAWTEEAKFANNTRKLSDIPQIFRCIILSCRKWKNPAIWLKPEKPVLKHGTVISIIKQFMNRITFKILLILSDKELSEKKTL